MKLTIKSGINSFEVSTKASSSVATLKATLQQSPGFEDDKLIELEYKGRFLEDHMPLKAYGLKSGSVVYNTLPRTRTPYSKIDYTSVAQEIEQKLAEERHGGQDPADFPEDWDATWRGGTEWQKYPPVIVDIWDEDSRASVDPRVKRRRNKRRDPNPASDTVEEKGEEEDEPMAGEGESEARKRRQAGEVTSLILPPPPGAVFKSSNLRPRGVFPSSSSRVPKTRRYRQAFVAEVGRFQYRVVHRMEGRWSGDVKVTLQDGRQTERVVSVDFFFDEAAGLWKEKQSLTTADGLKTSQELVYEPMGDGLLRVKTGDSAVDRELDMRLTEQSDFVLILTAFSHRTGRPLVVETMTLVDDMRRVRSVQHFDDDGSFKCMYLINESRVLDTVTGAVELRK